MDTNKDALKMKAPKKVHTPFIPSSTKMVRFVNEQGYVVKQMLLNRKDRRKLKIWRK